MYATVMLPSKANKKKPRTPDKNLYKERNSLESLFNKLKDFSCFITPYCKAKLHFEAFINLACAWFWLN